MLLAPFKSYFFMNVALLILTYNFLFGYSFQQLNLIGS